MDTFLAWQNNRPVYDRLPGDRGAYQVNDPTNWITKYWDDFLVYQKTQVDLLLTQNLNPETCDEEFLDYLGFISGFTKDTWDRNWPPSAKRKLIKEAYTLIWLNPGSINSISFIISAFDIQNRVIKTGDFLIGISEVGDPIGDIYWDYTIFLPTRYQGTNTVKLVEKLNYLFGVCYCYSRIIFDDSKFVNAYILINEQETAFIATEDNKALELE
jgi:Phage tail protein (Tail_P2_I)